MKKRLVYIVVFLLVSIASIANQNPNYRNFESYEKDSVQYLKENFQNNDFYIGKTVKTLLDDLEIQVKCSDFGPDFFGDLKVYDAILYFDEDNVVSKTIVVDKKVKALIKMHVFFEPIDNGEYGIYESILRKARKNNEVNNDTEWELFEKAFLENRIITKISVPDVVR